MTIEGKTINKERVKIEIDPKSGLISKIGSPTGKADIVLKEEIIFPGFIDLHVHARECADHSQDYKEDFKTAGEAAKNGGVVAIAEMPNNPVPPIDNKSYEEKRKLTEKSPIEVILYAGIGPGTKSLSKKVPYKAFMGPSVGDLFFHSNEELEDTIKNYVGEYISFHCEDPEILEEHKNEPVHELKRPPEAETRAVDFAIELIKKYNLKGKICHCSTLSSLERIIKAKKERVNVTVEITPHHLYFDQGMIDEENRKWLQINPPLRNKEDRLKAIEYLKNGDIDYLATDHAPHTIEEKEKGTSGMPHLDTYGLFATWLIKKHGFSLEEISRVCSENPGKFINNFTEMKYGKIEKGYAGSLTILDLEKSTTVEKKILKTKCGWSPFEGITFPGSVVETIIKGKI